MLFDLPIFANIVALKGTLCMKNIKYLFVLPLILLMLNSKAFAATYYVATNGNDGNPGTLAQPWATFNHAADTAVTGDTVYFRGGTYTNNKRVKMYTNGPIAFQNYSRETPVFRFTGDSDYGFAHHTKFNSY